MHNRIRQFKTSSGEPYRLTALPLPRAIYDGAGRTLAANYANFVIINGAVLVPSYGDPMDVVAQQRLSECFPDRTIIPIPALPLIKQNGSLHCMTMHFYH